MVKIVFRENLSLFWLRHILQRAVKKLRRKREHSLKICAFPDDQIGRDIAVTGIYEAAGIKAIEWLISRRIIDLPEDSCFLDIGANVGVYSLSFAKTFNTVVAFEPHPVIKKILALNIEINDIRNILVSPFALSDSNGDAKLVDRVDNAGAAFIGGDGGRGENDVVYDVEVKKASEAVLELLPPPMKIALIKIDVEGHEIQVIKGLKDILLESLPVIAFEANNSLVNANAISTLQELGYKRFVALDFQPSSPFTLFRVLILSFLGVKYALKNIENIQDKKYSLVFALNDTCSKKWQNL